MQVVANAATLILQQNVPASGPLQFVNTVTLPQTGLLIFKAGRSSLFGHVSAEIGLLLDIMAIWLLSSVHEPPILAQS